MFRRVARLRLCHFSRSRIIGMWVCNESQLPEIPPIGLGMKPNTSPGQEALAEMGDSAQANGHDHLKIESRTTV